MASLVDWLAYSGARKSDGTAVASGTAYFYRPGTTSTQVTAYSDKDGLTAITQPVVLDAAGRAVVYLKAPARIRVLDSTGVEVRLEDRANTVNASQVEVEQTGFTGTDLVTGTQVDGGRTDLSTVLGTLNTSFGGSGDFQYRESPTATARTFAAAIGLWVTPQDYGALGDDSNDDTVPLTNAVNRCIAAGKGLFVPPGTYRVSAAIPINNAAAAGLRIFGASRSDCVIKNMSTSTSVFTVDLGSAIESHIYFENFSISANTTSTAAAILFTNGDGPTITRVATSGHRIGFDVAAISAPHLEDCLVTSTDSNAAGKGFRLGASATAYRCRAVHTNGRGFSLEAAFARTILCRSTITTGIGYDLAAADTGAFQCQATGTATGFSTAAVARVATVQCVSTDGSTADYAETSGATLGIEVGNQFTTRTTANAYGSAWQGNRGLVFKKNKTSTNSAIPIGWTPDLTLGEVQVWQYTGTTAITVTVASTSTATLIDGQTFFMVMENLWNGGVITVTLNAVYAQAGSVPSSLAARGSTGSLQVVRWMWRASNSTWVPFGSFLTQYSASAAGFW